jgi:AAA+ superfamily predicted ATPase
MKGDTMEEKQEVKDIVEQDNKITPVKSIKEVEMRLKYNMDLSDVPEPMYRIANKLSTLLTVHPASNNNDLIQTQICCDLFYTDDDPDEKDLKKHYDKDTEVNVLSFAAKEAPVLNDACRLGVRRFRADVREENGIVPFNTSFFSCSSTEMKYCYLARYCYTCIGRIASYLHYIRLTKPDAEYQMREEYKKKEFETYKLLEPLLFHFSNEYLSTLNIPTSALRLAKRIIDTAAVLPYTVWDKEKRETYRLTIGYPACMSDIFSESYKGKFSEEEFNELESKNEVIPYRFKYALYIPSSSLKREEFFRDVFLGKYETNARTLVSLIAIVYDLLQEERYETFYNQRKKEEEEITAEIKRSVKLGKNINGYYGVVIGEDTNAVEEKANKLASALQTASPYLNAICIHESISQFMEHMTDGIRDGYSDTVDIQFKYPKTNTVYILNGLSFWMRYNKYNNKEYTNDRAKMMEHCLKILREYRPDVYIILTGTQTEVDEFYTLDIVFETLYKPHTITVPNDTPEDVYHRFLSRMSKTDPVIEKDTFLDYVSRNTDYFPFRGESLACYLSDCVKTTGEMPPDFNTRNIQNAEKALDEMVGMDSVKKQVKGMSKYLQFTQKAKQFNMNIPVPNNHMLFTGNPGTGKTTVARIIAKMLYHFGICKKDKFVEIQGTDMVGKYLGQTAGITKEVIESALDGVLFVDEAYAISDGTGAGGNDYGKEAMSVLIKMMEVNKDRLVIIFAGYKDKMETFVEMNPGMKSRIGYTFDFSDYNEKEMTEIFCRKAHKAGFTVRKGVREKIVDHIRAALDTEGSGNGRFIDKLMQEIIIQHAANLEGIKNLKVLSPKDVPPLEHIRKNLLGIEDNKNPIGFTTK